MNFILTKPETGKLVQLLPNGKRKVLEENKPFSYLQNHRMKLVREGIKKETLKITY